MKIYVGNLSKETTEPQLRETFEKFGEVTSTTIVMDKETGKSRGFGFVEMTSNEHAKAAISKTNLTSVGGNSLKVSEANKT